MLYQLPTVQIIGAQKAGTSAIADWLFNDERDGAGFTRPTLFDNEPDFYNKEVHFFDINHRFCQGVEFYAQRYSSISQSCPSHRPGLDATPETFAFPDRVRATYEAAGGNQVNTVKFIVILREPVARELSLYNHLVYDCLRLPAAERNSWHNQVLVAEHTANESDGIDSSAILAFDDFVYHVSLPGLSVNDGPGRSSRLGLYALYLRQWFRVFNRNQILVLSYDELQNDAQRLQQRIRDFLGVSATLLPDMLPKSNCNDGPHKVKAPSPEAQQALNLIFEPFNEELYRLLEDSPGPPMEQRPFPKFHDTDS